MTPKLDLRGRVVLVTGARRGIGLATARGLAAKGASLALVDLDGAELEQRAGELGGALAITADVTDRAAMRAAVAATVERFGGLDVVVANAGIAGSSTPLRAAGGLEEFERVVGVDLLGVARTIQPALEHVIARRGHVLAVASAAALVPFPLHPGYGASKAAVESLMRSLRAELTGTGASAGAAYFGYIDTEMVRAAREDPIGAEMFESQPRFMRRMLPVERAGQAMVEGIEQRRARVWAPRWVGVALLLRGLMQRFDDAALRRGTLEQAVRLAEQAAAADSDDGACVPVREREAAGR